MARLESAHSHTVPVYQSFSQSMRVAPYFERRLDRWKLAVLIPLFLLLLAGAVYRQRVNLAPLPVDTPASSVTLPQADSTQADLTQADLTQDESNQARTTLFDDSTLEGQPGVTAEQPIAREYSLIPSLPLNNVAGQAPIMPITLVKPAPNTAISQNETSVISGTAAPGSQVIIEYGSSAGSDAEGNTVYQMQMLGKVDTGIDGRWQLWLASPLQQGAHRLSIKQLDVQSGMQTAITPVDFRVVGAGESPLSNLIPIINSPQSAARLSSTCSGPVTYRFNGIAMPGWIIQLYINEQPAGKVRVGINQSWEVAIEQPLAPGSYIARALLLSPGGEVAAESSPAAFTMHPCQ